MIYILYDILLFLAVPIVVPWYLVRHLRRGRLRKGLGERLGCIASEKLDVLEDSSPIWVHAVSVGEVMAAKPLLKALKTRWPDRRIVVSTVTETGRKIADGVAEADLRIFFPFDFGFAVKGALDAIRPSLIVITETEIWPNFLRHSRRRGIPVVMANGRISDKSFSGYLRFSWLFRRVLDNFAAFCMQTGEDAARIISLGAPKDRVHVVMNLKYDIPVMIFPEERKAEIRARYRIPHGIPILTAGSTHQGENEAVIRACLALKEGARKFFLVIAPRHPERSGEVANLLTEAGIPFARRSGLGNGKEWFHPGEALLVDTVGELMDLYSISDLAFVGGSLVPKGGHNVLEPASRGVPVLFGPHMNNFREIAARILECGGGAIVDDPAMLAQIFRELLDSPTTRKEMGGRGAELLVANSGSTGRHMAVISALLSGQESSEQTGKSVLGESVDA